jgi:hypothetical protein
LLGRNHRDGSIIPELIGVSEFLQPFRNITLEIIVWLILRRKLFRRLALLFDKLSLLIEWLVLPRCRRTHHDQDECADMKRVEIHDSIFLTAKECFVPFELVSKQGL